MTQLEVGVDQIEGEECTEILSTCECNTKFKDIRVNQVGLHETGLKISSRVSMKGNDRLLCDALDEVSKKAMGNILFIKRVSWMREIAS